MMNELLGFAMAVVIVVVAMLVLNNWSMYRTFHATIQSMEDARAAERQQWADERAQLMDRIQAESFREYKTEQTKQIKVLKAEPEAPPQPLL